MKDGISFELSAELKQYFKEAPEKALQASKAALYAEAEGIMTQSKEIVPIDTTTLRQSGTVLLPEVQDGKVSVTMGYGGNAEDYALKQHEDLTLFHPNGGTAKFLEIPLKQAAGGMLTRIAADIKKAVKGS